MEASAEETVWRFVTSESMSPDREARARLDGMASRLESVSPDAVLKRGYALVFDTDGAPLTAAAAVPRDAAIRIRFADGEVRAQTGGARGPAAQGRLDI